MPDQVPDGYKAAYNFTHDYSKGTADARNTFAGMLTALDEGVGNITRALEAHGMLEETLIWFQTDNGAATPACGGNTGKCITATTVTGTIEDVSHILHRDY